MISSTGGFGNLSPVEAIKALESSPQGLTNAEAQKRLEKTGLNELAQKKKNLFVRILLEQVSDFMVLILVAAALILFFVVNEALDALVILAIVVLNTAVGFIQEYKAENAIEAISKMSALKTRVLRDNRMQWIDSKLLVPGDVVLLEAGDKVPADARILESYSLLVDESSLTGESTPVEKKSDELPKETPLGEQSNRVFKQTIIANGKARVLVTATGMKTEIGRIAGMLSEIEPEDTPLVKRLKQASLQIAIFVVATCVLVFVLGYLQQKDMVELALVAISLAVAAVPEGLPAIITITLTVGATMMAQKKSIVRKIQAVETIGNCTVICSDKTGTLTKNEMTVTTVVCRDSEYSVTGAGFGLDGKILKNQKEVSVQDETELEKILSAAVMVNDARLTKTEQNGDATELSLLVAAHKAGIQQEELNQRFEIVEQFPFNTDRKRMSIQAKTSEGFTIFVKGSCEAVLDKSNRFWSNGKEKLLTEKEKAFFLEKNSALALSGLRVLGIGYRTSSQKVLRENMEENLVFLGLIGMIDSPRPEAAAAIQKCHAAGIEVKMITGDHPLTAFAVGKELALCDAESDVVTGSQLDQMTQLEREKAYLEKKIFARVNPEHKLQIVRALQKAGHVVGMTGDGVNDGPALKQADVGFAMGITGTDVAKEAAQIILADDNFATIVTGIEEGRRIYSNVRGFMKYLFAANLAEILIILIAIGLDWTFIPLIAIQILWLNLATDGLPALALGAEKGSGDEMTQKPRSLSEGLLHQMKAFILVAGIVGAIVTLGIFNWSQGQGDPAEVSRTLAFNALVFFELVLVFNCRKENKTVFESPFWDNPKLIGAVLLSIVLQIGITNIGFLQEIFKTSALSIEQWGVVIGLSFVALAVPYLERMVTGLFSKVALKKESYAGIVGNR